MKGTLTIASAKLRLQVGDQVAEVTLPASFLPARPVYSSALWAGFVPSMSSPTSWRRGPRAASASRARRPVKWPFLKSTSHARPSSSGERSVPRYKVWAAETKSRFGSTKPASMRAMFSALEPMGRTARVRPTSINASHTASASGGCIHSS
jgi:hypothetical protein